LKIAEQVYALAQEQKDAALMLGAYNALSCTLYFLGDFEGGRKYARQGVHLWRSGGVQSYAEDLYTPAVGCLCFGAVSEWHLGEIASCQEKMDEAISIAKELNEISALALALSWAAFFGYAERNPAEVDRLASDLIELSTRHNFVYWLAIGAIWRGWARSAAGDTEEGIPWIEHGIEDFRATGSVLALPSSLARKAEALYLADRTPEALEAINEADALAERYEQLYWSAELHRLRGVFLAKLGADAKQVEASFRAAIHTAHKQNSISLKKRAEATCAEYGRQKEKASGGQGLRLPLC
jgi:tetratricopeptide (TPR) repeat protein